MPITDTNVVSLEVDASTGEHRGTLQFIFNSGEFNVERDYNAIDNVEWSNLILDMPAIIEEEIQQKHAEEAVEQDIEVQNYREAGKKQVALKYLRNAHQQDDPYIAYLKFSKFNDHRVAEGLTLNQVQAYLASVGLEAEEWIALKDAYQWVAQADRVNAMLAYQGVLAGWPDYKG